MTINHSAYLNRHSDETSFYNKLLVKRRLNGLFGELYVGRRVKLAYLEDLLKTLEISSTAQIMEAGSGDGAFCFYLSRRYPRATITGLELNAIEATACQKIADRETRTNLHFVEGDITKANWHEQYDFLLTLDVLVEIKEDRKALEAMYGALRKGGDLLVHVPNRTIMQVDGSMVSVPDTESWKVTAGCVRHGYTPEELTEKLTDCGFQVKLVKPVQGLPIAKAFRLYERYKSYLPFRFLILPIIDAYIRMDKKRAPEHGNSTWVWAQKP